MSERNQQPTKAVATVRAVAQMVGLSPGRFYQLQQAGVFPLPVYAIDTRRPHYTEEQQRECLEVRRRNCGINGKPVLFYARRIVAVTAPQASRRSGKLGTATVKGEKATEIVEGLKALGLKSVTTTQVNSALNELFPKGVTGADTGEVIRAVFIHLRRQNTGDSVG